MTRTPRSSPSAKGASAPFVMKAPASLSAGASPTLALQLCWTAQVLQGTWLGQSWTNLQPQVPPALRPGVQALVFLVWRELGRAHALRQHLVAKSPSKPVDALVQTALALLMAEPPMYAEHTLVSQTVEAARAQRTTEGAAGFINACLRRFLREKSVLLQEIARQRDGASAAELNHPDWWVAQVRRDHPTEGVATLLANQTPGAMTLRFLSKESAFQAVKPAQAAPNSIADTQPIQARRPAPPEPNTIRSALLQQAWAMPVGGPGISSPFLAWVADPPLPVGRLAGFDSGAVSVQDAAAQLAAPLLLAGFEAQPGRPLRVLDACAAPGGKTTHLWELLERRAAPARLIALDMDAQRCERIHQNLQRVCGNESRAAESWVDVEVIVADAAQPGAWHDGQLFDLILLDAPCTASGIVRRHPDIRWLRRQTDIAQLATQQRRLLDALWPLVAPGGRLLYATCSVFRAEGSDQATAFAARNTDATDLPAPGHLLPRSGSKGELLPHNEPSERDGFFYALFEKRPAP